MIGRKKNDGRKIGRLGPTVGIPELAKNLLKKIGKCIKFLSFIHRFCNLFNFIMKSFSLCYIMVLKILSFFLKKKLDMLLRGVRVLTPRLIEKEKEQIPEKTKKRKLQLIGGSRPTQLNQKVRQVSVFEMLIDFLPDVVYNCFTSHVANSSIW